MLWINPAHLKDNSASLFHKSHVHLLQNPIHSMGSKHFLLLTHLRHLYMLPEGQILLHLSKKNPPDCSAIKRSVHLSLKLLQALFSLLEGLSEALHVSIEWLRGETDEYETDITDKKELQIRDAMGDILKQLPLDLSKKEDAFSKDLLLLMLKQYNLFLESFQFACKNYKGNTNEADIAKVMGFESNDEYNEIMFLREITHTVNAFNDMADIVRLYSKKPEMAEQRLENLLSEVLYEDSDSV